ncbi:MAG TPA: hypothetical protein VFU37_16770, partial [Pyrinomonadaceae bacterium]|nr:hypothetical protein [Pyrinomonadaceae bacterium]
MTLPHRVATFRVVTILFLLAIASSLSAQTSSNSSTGTQSTTEGIQKHWNEWGIWGGISFDAPTLIGKTPSARFGEIGLRYGRVLAASKSVAFEWTIDAVPLSIISNERLIRTSSPFVFTVGRKSVYGFGAAPIGLKFNFRRNRQVQ